jgi:hypothetical protein
MMVRPSVGRVRAYKKNEEPMTQPKRLKRMSGGTCSITGQNPAPSTVTAQTLLKLLGVSAASASA